MNRFLAVSAIVSIFATVSSAGAQEKALSGPAVHNDIRFRMPEVQETKLSNGIRVQFVQRSDVPLVSVHVVSTMGAADAAPGVAELAARAAVSSAYYSYWVRTTGKMNLIGARLHAYAGYGRTGISTRVMSPYLEQGLCDLREVLNAQFPDSDKVRQARDEAIDALERAERSSALYAARSLLYPPTHPYHFAESGTVSALRSIEPSALRGYWARAFVPGNITIAASGDVTFDRLVKALEQTFGDLSRGPVTTPSAPMASGLEERKGIVLVDQPGTTQARIAVAGRGVPRLHPDYYGMHHAIRVLDGLLHDRIREAYGSSYGVDASLEHERGTAPFWVYGSVENGGVAKALEQILGAMSDIRTAKVKPGDFEHNRMLAFHYTARSFETGHATASLLASASALGMTGAELRALPDRVNAVTPDQVTRLAKEHFDPARLRIVVCGDAKLLTPELERLGLGPVQVRKP
jgi:zinc protease